MNNVHSIGLYSYIKNNKYSWIILSTHKNQFSLTLEKISINQ